MICDWQQKQSIKLPNTNGINEGFVPYRASAEGLPLVCIGKVAFPLMPASTQGRESLTERLCPFALIYPRWLSDKRLQRAI